MHIADVYNRCRSDAIFICGTGPSIRVFPLEILEKAVSIGLNQFWKHAPTTYSITVHPELLDAYEAAYPQGGRTQWFVKKKPPRADLTFDDPRYYVFETSPELKTVTERPIDRLLISEGVQCTAMDLAARMGAKLIILVGCDGTNLGGDFHADSQHVRWLGQKPADQYALYRKRTAQVRKILRDVHEVNVVTMTPFVSAGFPEEDYLRLCQELNLPRLPPPKDTSPYKRPTPKG